MPDYWVDSNVFIEAKNGPYGFDIVPGFWDFLDEMSDVGTVASSSVVYGELVLDSEDELADWAKRRRGPPLFMDPDEDVQRAYRTIADHVLESYEGNQADIFLRKADPWLIAHAIASEGKVATQETRVDPRSKKIKIPNICDAFGIETVNMYQMMRELGASIG